MRWWVWSAVAWVGVGASACERPGAAEAQDREDSTPLVVKEAPLESEGVIGGEDVAEFSGTVTAVSRTQVIIRGENGDEQPFEIDDETDFYRRGQPVERTELQEGKKVRTRYDEREGEKVADQIEIY